MLICIDAGHCLSTPGKRCLKSIDLNETREWVLNSRVANKLEAILAGYSCQTMRVDDVTGQRAVTLSQRVAAANRARAGGGICPFTTMPGSTAAPAAGSWPMWAPSHQKQSEVVPGRGVPLYRGFHRPAGQPSTASGGAEPVCAQLHHHAGHADRAWGLWTRPTTRPSS